MNTHKLKIKSGPFAALASGVKTGEVRNCSDRNFQVGDTVELRLIDETGNPTGQEMHRRISHIQTGYGLPEEICVLSYEPLSAATCPGHGRSEYVSCCWPKGELEGKRADRMVFDEKSRIGELANLLTLAKAHVPITDPLRGLINANLMQHLVEQDPWADFKDAAPVPEAYTAVDMGTAAADGYRDGKANPELQMHHVALALESVRGGPVLTSNQCYDLARALNGIQRDQVKS